MKIKTITFGIAAAALGVLGACSAQAQSVGEQEYMRSCATCHGVDGTSNTPFSDLLTMAPPDLTTLAGSNDGVFPMLEVIHLIDGRSGLRGHGSEMPIWGDRYSNDADLAGTYGAELIVRGRVLELAEYLASIQQ
jgi:mono/diheme cytochrome c family protein